MWGKQLAGPSTKDHYVFYGTGVRFLVVAETWAGHAGKSTGAGSEGVGKATA